MFTVSVKLDCPHVEDAVKDLSIEKLDTKFKKFAFECSECHDETENWICLTCSHISCSSYVNSHMIKHKENTKHKIALGFNDLSVWCYECEEYISHKSLFPTLKFFQKLKFDSPEENKKIEELLSTVGLNPASNLITKKKYLNTRSIEGLAEYISSGKCSNVVIVTGAGLSVAAGIPDFRSPNIGLYSQLSSYNLPTPESIFSIDFFAANPKPFYTLAKTFLPSLNVKPTIGHYLLTLFEKKGILLRNYTQNIDLLEEKAGLSDEKIVYAHGSLKSAKCIKCSKEHSMDVVYEEAANDNVPICSCGGFIKPNVVFFGEKLTDKFVANCQDDLQRNCDLLIIMGTSLKVHPIAYLPKVVKESCPRVVVNLEDVNESGFDFEDEDNRDYFYKGTIDQFALDLVNAIGPSWSEELNSLTTIPSL